MFKLHNMLHVPAITKNLINVSKFAKDNNIYFEFHANLCYVKNQETHQILLQGVIKDGLLCFRHRFQLLLPLFIMLLNNPRYLFYNFDITDLATVILLLLSMF